MKKVLIFGVGNNFISKHNYLKEKFKIVGLIDNSADKQKLVIDGMPVVPLEKIKDYKYDMIIVTPNAYAEIIPQLVRYGIDHSLICRLEEVTSHESSGRFLSIGFYIHGGLGDYLVAANYLYYFSQRFWNENVKIDVFCETGYKSAPNVFKEGGMVNKIYRHEKDSDYVSNYDLFIKLSRYPEVVRKSTGKIVRYQPDLIDYILGCEKFKIFNQRFFNPSFMTDGQSAVMCLYEGKKRIQQPDIFGMLGIKEEYDYPLFIEEDENVYLKEHHLQKGKYITVHRGCDERYSSNSVKLWPLPYYNTLIKSIREEYPDLKIVQIGVSHDRCPDILDIDLNMVGKTSLEQVKVLLKNSFTHIDNEGGMVHLRHALKGGRSIVIFGPTSDKFYGYSENINLRGNGCPHWCEWVTDDWQSRCARGYSEAPCMDSILPWKVMEAMHELMNEGAK